MRGHHYWLGIYVDKKICVLTGLLQREVFNWSGKYIFDTIFTFLFDCFYWDMLGHFYRYHKMSSYLVFYNLVMSSTLVCIITVSPSLVCIIMSSHLRESELIHFSFIWWKKKKTKKPRVVGISPASSGSHLLLKIKWEKKTMPQWVGLYRNEIKKMPRN